MTLTLLQQNQRMLAQLFRANAEPRQAQCFVIAEAGVNHNGRLDMAYQLIQAAAQANANAVKFQLFDPEQLVSHETPLAQYQQNNQNKNASLENQSQLLKALTLPKEALFELKAYAERLGLVFLCSPFDLASAEFLVNDLQIPALKIASGELTNTPFLADVSHLCASAATPILLSTGMAHIGEIWNALMAIGKTSPIGLLHCISAYPAPEDQLNLSAIQTLKSLFPNRVIGYSDHSLSPLAPALAVVYGAKIIEKHLTLDTTLPGPDHAASLAPEEFSAMVASIRQAELMRGHGQKHAQPCEIDCIRVARKSVVATRDLEAGHILTEDDMTIKRPGTGFSPSQKALLIGEPLRQAIKKDVVLRPDILRPECTLQPQSQYVQPFTRRHPPEQVSSDSVFGHPQHHA